MKQQRGFTYLAVLMAIALMGLGLAAAGTSWQLQSRREKERDLLDAGHELRAALVRYYKASPTKPYQYPRQLEELIQDPRYPFLRRHLRSIPRDPFTGRPEWGLIRGPSGEIIGVHSLARDTPLKRSGFIPEEKNFEKAATYRDWQFIRPL